MVGHFVRPSRLTQTEWLADQRRGLPAASRPIKTRDPNFVHKTKLLFNNPYITIRGPGGERRARMGAPSSGVRVKANF